MKLSLHQSLGLLLAFACSAFGFSWYFEFSATAELWRAFTVGNIGGLLGMAISYLAFRNTSAAALKAHAEKEDWLQRVNDHILDAMVCLDRDLMVLTFNQHAETMFGIERSTAIGKSLKELWPNSAQLELLNQAYEALEKSKGQEQIVQVLEGYRHNGETFQMEVAISRIVSGITPIYVLLLRDNSEYLAINRRALRSEAVKQAIVDSALSARITIDESGNVIDFNRAAQVSFGYSLEEIRGKSMVDHIVPDDLRDAHNAGFKHYLKTGEGPVLNQLIEISAKRRNGEIFPIELTILALELEDEKLFAAEVRDITERKAFENELKQARRLAEASNQEKSRFVATMSHEIRTPLNAVLGILHLLQDKMEEPEQLELCKTAERSGKHLLSIINDVLDFSKIESGKLTLENEDFNLHEMIQDIVDVYALRGSEKQLEVACIIDPKLPLVAHGDSARLGQVLINLVGNALKFTEHGGIIVEVTKAAEDNVVFRVEDTGCGIDPEHHQQLFNEFTQADSSNSRSFTGTGLGLAISKRIVKLMGGQIGLSSKVGEGSVFTVQVPLPTVQENQKWPAIQSIQRLLVATDGSLTMRSIFKQLSLFGLNPKAIEPGELKDGGWDLLFVRRNYTRDDLLHKAQLDDAKIVVVQPNSNPQPITSALNYLEPLLPDSLYHCICKAMGLATPQSPGEIEDVTRTPVIDDPGSLRILLAEDSRINQLVAINLLATVGYQVDVASNGFEAYNAVHNLPYDLVLMDVQMPEMSGLDATRQIRASASPASTIPIIALTANAFQHDLDACIEAGMNDWVTKPIDKHILLSKIYEFANKPSTEDSLAFDVARFEKLAGQISPTAMNELLSVFIAETQTQTKQLKTLLMEQEYVTIGRIAHTIKGSAASLGCVELSEHALQLEKMAKGQDEHGLIANFSEFLATAESATDTLQQLLLERAS